MLQGLPVAELNVKAKSVSVSYHDANTHGKDSDAININLRLKGNKFDLLLEMMQNAIAAKVCLLPYPTAFHKPPSLMWFCDRWPRDQLLLLSIANTLPVYKRCRYMTIADVALACTTSTVWCWRCLLCMQQRDYSPVAQYMSGSALLMVPALECRQQRPSCMQWTGPSTALRTQRSMAATLSLA